MPRLSAFVTTFNDEATIGACLESLKFADEIVVLDSFSTDGTLDIARQYTDRIVQHAFLGYGRQKQSALEKCHSDWVLFLDSDEMITPQLQRRIKEVLLDDPPVDGYAMPRHEQMFWKMADERTRHNYFLRLFRRERVKFSTMPIHAAPILQGRMGRLHAPFYHFGETSVHEKVEKLNGYSTGLVSFREKQGKTASPLAMLFYPPFVFFRQWIFKRHFYNGWAGFIASVCMAFYAFMKCAKAYESACRKHYGSSLLPSESPNSGPPVVEVKDVAAA